MELAGLCYELHLCVARKSCLRSRQAGLLEKATMLLVFLWCHLLEVSIFSRIRATRKVDKEKLLVFSYFEIGNSIISKTYMHASL